MAQNAPKTLEDKELQDYYESLFAMYGTRGWKALQGDLEGAIQSHNTLAGVNSEAELWFRKGQLDQMLWLQNHQRMTEHAFSELLSEREGAAEQAVTGGKAQVVAPEIDPLS